MNLLIVIMKNVGLDLYKEIKDLVKTLNEEDYKNELIDIAKRLFSNDKILHDRLL